MALTKPKLSTNINTDSSVFTDPILVLHQGSSVADVDVGFLMNRSNGLTSNAAVIWQESSKSFVHILTDSSGAPDANLNVQSYANVSVGNVLLINNAGIYVDGTLGTAGQVLASDGSKTYWAPPGGFTGGTVSGATVFQSNLVVSNTTTSTNTTTGALVVLGGAGVSGNLYVSNISVGSGNIQFAQKSGMISGATAYLSLLGNPSGSAGISALELAGYTGVAGGTQSRLDFVSKVSNVFYNTSRISSINGPSSTGAGQLVFSTTPDGGSPTERLRIKDDGPIVTAANIVAVGSATSNTTTGAIVVVGGIGLSGGIIAGGNIVAAAVTNSVSTTTGALVVRGGVGVAGNVYTDKVYTTTGIYWAGNGASFSSGSGGGSPFASNIVITSGTATTNTTTGAIVVTGSGGLAVGGVGIFGGNLVAAATTSTSSVTTGALVVQGGVGIAGNIYVGGVSNLAGNVTVTGNILPGANGTYSIGTPGNTFTTVYAKATSAQYADLAEIYVPDRHYEPGTVVVFGGDREITETTADHDPRVAGVISTNPAYLMNSESTGVPVALTGRVPCHVQGPVDKGDLLVTSNISGVAQRLVADKFRPGCIIGKSLECIMHDEIKLIEIVVGRF